MPSKIVPASDSKGSLIESAIYDMLWNICIAHQNECNKSREKISMMKK